jgi:hypothetical protein
VLQGEVHQPLLTTPMQQDKKTDDWPIQKKKSASQSRGSSGSSGHRQCQPRNPPVGSVHMQCQPRASVGSEGGYRSYDWGWKDGVGRMSYRRAEGRRQIRNVEKTKDVEREDLWRFVMSNDLISLSIDNRLY